MKTSRPRRRSLCDDLQINQLVITSSKNHSRKMIRHGINDKESSDQKRVGVQQIRRGINTVSKGYLKG